MDRSLKRPEIIEIIMNDESADETDDDDGDLFSDENIEVDIGYSHESDSEAEAATQQPEIHIPILMDTDESQDTVEEEEEEIVLDGPQNSFEWRKLEPGKFTPTIFDFDETRSGINHDNFEVGDECSESDCFRALFDQDLVEHIALETNRYYDQYRAKHPNLQPNSKIHKWYNTTFSELYAFFAVIMLMAHNKKNKIADYWSTDLLLESPVFRKVFSLDRFSLILRLLHFADNSNQIPGDRLHKITIVLHTLKVKFSQVFTPFRNLCIDESMLQWKGRLSFKQYLPRKRHRFGIKLFILCDCKTGFIMDMVVYTGKQTMIVLDKALGISGSVVTTFLEPFLDMGHTLYIDNWYSSPHLTQYLFLRNTGAVGTVRLDRKDMPKFRKLKTGEYESQKTSGILVEKWVDRRDVNIISTTHKNEMVASAKTNYATGDPIVKPASVIDYNKNMGLIDKSDMQISFNDTARKTTKWYKKMFFHLLDMAVLNSYTLYKMKTGKPNLQLSRFRINLIRQLLEDYSPTRASTSGGRRSKEPAPLRLSARHFPALIPSTAQKQKPRRKCFVCKNTSLGPQKRRETPWMCTDCAVPLCLPECFRAYHTLKNF